MTTNEKRECFWLTTNLAEISTMMPAFAAPSRRRRKTVASTPSILIVRGLAGAGIASLLFIATAVFVIERTSPRNPKNMPTLFGNPSEIPSSVLSRLDAIVVLGGGRPQSLEEPPVYVQRRCDDAASVARLPSVTPLVPILCLSAGTAHLPQLMDTASGLPIWEATSSAAYLSTHHNMTANVYVETTSYDTIGNAFFARTSHTDVAGWRRLLIVTSEFHMARTQVIFDWVFGLDPIKSGSRSPYELYYLQSPNAGLSDDVLVARHAKESQDEAMMHEFSKRYRTLRELWQFLTTEHGLYTASKLVERAKDQEVSTADELVKKTYGASV